MNPEAALRALYNESVEFVLIGGAALTAQASAYVTKDLDFRYDRSEANLRRLANALAPYHPRLRDSPADLAFRFDFETIRRGFNFTLQTDLGPIDSIF